MRVDKIEVYGLDESIRAAKFPMSVAPRLETTHITPGIIKLAQSGKGEGHDNWLNGVIAQFDLTCTNKMWVELQRYHFIDFVSSQSTMHRAAKMDLELCFNSYVTAATRAECFRLQAAYEQNPTEENYLHLLYNLPSGFELTARMTTNYRQLKTIYAQRKNHRLPEWRDFCACMKRELPRSYLFTGEKPNDD